MKQYTEDKYITFSDVNRDCCLTLDKPNTNFSSPKDEPQVSYAPLNPIKRIAVTNCADGISSTYLVSRKSIEKHIKLFCQLVGAIEFTLHRY